MTNSNLFIPNHSVLFKYFVSWLNIKITVLLFSHSVVSMDFRNPMDYSLLGPSVRGISQARILE